MSVLRVHIVTADIERLYALRTYFKEKTDWRISWGMARRMPLDSEVILLGVQTFVDIKAHDDRALTGKVLIVYGDAHHLANSFLLGCDDYLKLPWSVEEAYCRIEKFSANRPFFTIDGVKVTLYTNYLASGLEHVSITHTESRLLGILTRRKNSIVPLESMYHAVAKQPDSARNNEIRVLIHNIRKKLEAFSWVRAGKEIIATAPQRGYILQSN